MENNRVGRDDSVSPRPPPKRIVYECIPNDDDDGNGCGDDGGGSSNDESTKNLRRRRVVIMLHGWAQNTTVFAQRSKKLTKRLTKNGYKVILIQAPHRLPPKKELSTNEMLNQESTTTNAIIPSSSREYAYAWFLYNNHDDDDDDDEANGNNNTTIDPRPSPTGEFVGLEESLKFLQQEINNIRNDMITKTHPCDDNSSSPSPSIFILGFSQGAVLVHKIATLVCAERQSRKNSSSSAFKGNTELSSSSSSSWICVEKCILISGFSFYDTTTTHPTTTGYPLTTNHVLPTTTTRLRQLLLPIPTLHVIGSKDIRVSPNLSEELVTNCGFVNPQVWNHNRGHIVPQDVNFCDYVLRFLKEN